MGQRENTPRGRTILSNKLSAEEFNRWLEMGTDALTMENRGLTVYLIKVPETADFDFLYRQVDNTGSKNSRQAQFSFCGLYSRLDHSLYCTSESLSCIVRDWKTDLSRSDAVLLNAFNSAVNQRVEALVADSRENLSVQGLTDAELVREYHYYREYGVEQDAIRRLFAGASLEDIRFVSEYQVLELSDQMLLDYLTDRDGCVDRTARDFIAAHEEQILKNLMEDEFLRTVYEELLVNISSPLHRMKAISDAVKQSGAKTVTVTVQKEGQELTFKTTANSLVGYRNKYYSSEIAAADRREFERLFGRYTDYRAEDIQKITYGRNTIYEASELSMDEVQEAAPGPTMIMGGM